MSAADLGGGSRSRRNTGVVRKLKRAGFVLDMTPLVDVAFLLLTFFMFATTMAQPQVMEMRIPPSVEPSIVPASSLWNLYVRRDGKLFHDSGVDPGLRPLNMNELKPFAVQRNSEQGNDLVTTLRVDPAATYARLVEVLDELNLAEGNLQQMYGQRNMQRERRFTIINMTPEEKTRLEQQP